MEYKNNAFFWQKVDSLIYSSEPELETRVVINKFNFKTGYFKSESNNEEKNLEFILGNHEQKKVDYLLIIADILKKKIRFKLLIGCFEDEAEALLISHNETDAQKAVLIKRGSEIPKWSQEM